MKTIIRLEELAFFAFSLYLFSSLSYPWWYFPILLFAPDLSMLAYLGGPGVGAVVYDLIHHRALALALYVLGMVFAIPLAALAGVMLFAHSSLDRVFGYGLKLFEGFQYTHLGRIGPSH